MKKHIVFTLLGLIALTGQVNAASGVVEIDGGQAKKYREMITINMDKLASGVAYYLECRIISDRYSGKGHDDIHVFNHAKVPVLVNGVDTALTDGLVTIKYPLNSLVSSGIRNGDEIMIRNLDKYDAITVEHCIATPVGA